MSVPGLRKTTRAFAFVAIVAVASIANDARADDVTVPEGLQAELVGKMAGYDRGFASRAGGRSHVLIFRKPNDDDSGRTASHLEAALKALPDIGGLPHDEQVVAWTGASALAGQVRDAHAAIVYFTPGFGGDIDAIRAALDGVDVLSVTAVADHVPRGIVLGFDLVSGKPKIMVNLAQARKQNVAFRAEVLKMARVFE